MLRSVNILVPSVTTEFRITRGVIKHRSIFTLF